MGRLPLFLFPAPVTEFRLLAVLLLELESLSLSASSEWLSLAALALLPSLALAGDEDGVALALARPFTAFFFLPLLLVEDDLLAASSPVLSLSEDDPFLCPLTAVADLGPGR